MVYEVTKNYIFSSTATIVSRLSMQFPFTLSEETEPKKGSQMKITSTHIRSYVLFLEKFSMTTMCSISISFGGRSLVFPAFVTTAIPATGAGRGELDGGKIAVTRQCCESV